MRGTGVSLILDSLIKKITVALCVVPLMAAMAFGQSAANADLTKAENFYKHTDFASSLALLDRSSSDAATNFLIGRNYFMMGEFKKSVEFLLKATDASPKNSDYMDWLGRAYGKRAETSNPLLAPGLASKARQAFEKSVELDPKNQDALGDLFDYYLEAPGFLGGGMDKALGVAGKTAALDPAEGYFEQAKVAQKRKEFDLAEDHFHKAIAMGPKQVGHLIALARFLAMQGRIRESDALFAEVQKANPNAARIWFARADVLVSQKRNLDEAKALLEKYMSASISVDDPPKDEARRLLKQAGGA
jgi:tetratricopeptide (TPR) repeat protein